MVDDQGKTVEPRQMRPAGGQTPVAPPAQYKVVLHRDEINLNEDIADWVFQITPLKPNASYQKMVEAGEQGRAVLVTVPKEAAELYQEQLASKGLTVSIEPA